MTSIAGLRLRSLTLTAEMALGQFCIFHLFCFFIRSVECRKRSGEERVAGKKLRCSSALVKAAEAHVSAFSPFRSFYAALALSAPECPYPEFLLSRLTRKTWLSFACSRFLSSFLTSRVCGDLSHPLRGIKVAFRFNVKDGGTWGETSYTEASDNRKHEDVCEDVFGMFVWFSLMEVQIYSFRNWCPVLRFLLNVLQKLLKRSDF